MNITTPVHIKLYLIVSLFLLNFNAASPAGQQAIKYSYSIELTDNQSPLFYNSMVNLWFDGNALIAQVISESDSLVYKRWPNPVKNPNFCQTIEKDNKPGISNTTTTQSINHPADENCIVYKDIVADYTQATCLDAQNLIFDESQARYSYSSIVFLNTETGNQSWIQLAPNDDGNPQTISSFNLNEDGSLIAYSTEDGHVFIETTPDLP